MPCYGSAAAEDPPATDIVQATQPDVADVPEEVFYEGSGAQAELVLSLLLGATLVYLVRPAGHVSSVIKLQVTMIQRCTACTHCYSKVFLGVGRGFPDCSCQVLGST